MLSSSILVSSCFLQLKDLIAGRKKFIKGHQAEHLEIPQYKSLSVERLYDFMSNYPDTFKYYPVQQEIYRLPKEWIANVAYSILGDLFSDWVHEQIEENHEKFMEKHQLGIDMDPEVHQAFLASTAISSKYHTAFYGLIYHTLIPNPTFFIEQKGASANILQASSKRRRTKTQVKADKEAAAQREAETQAQLAELA